MNIKRLLALTMAALFAPSCIELCGQRVSIHYDAAKDELRLLVFYDGVFETERPEKGEEALEKFLTSGSILFVDWPFHVEMAGIRDMARDERAPPALRAFAQAAATQISVKTLGSTKDARGRVGGAQLVTVKSAKSFVATVNAAIDEAIGGSWAPSKGWLRSGERMRAAAKKGFQWLAIDGDSLVLASPVHSGEWAVGMAEGLEGGLDELLTAATDDEGKQKKRDGLRNVIRGLTAQPLSYMHSGDVVQVRIGDKDRPSTMRFTLRDNYEPTLEGAIRKRVPADLTAALAARILGKKPATADALGEILAWGPPEEAVRALVDAAADPKRRVAALAALAQRAKAWSEGLAVPEAPPLGGTPETTLAAWREWLGKMERWPLF